MKKSIVTLFILSLALFLLAACGPATSGEETSADTDSGETASQTDTGSNPLGQPATLPTATPAPVLPQAPTDALLSQLPPYDEADVITTASGLQYVIYEEGAGDPPKAQDIIVAHYTGYLADGSKFDSSRDRGDTFNFPLGQGSVIQGWDEGFALLRPGAKALLIIPSNLGYGERGSGSIPPNSTLYFDVELVEVTALEPPVEVAEADYTVFESGIKTYDIAAGDGASPMDREAMFFDFTYWNAADGSRLGSSDESGQSITVIIGRDSLGADFEEAIVDMQVGGTRQVYIPMDATAGIGLAPTNDYIFELELTGIGAAPPAEPNAIPEDQFTTLESGIQYADLVVGDGPPLAEGDLFDTIYTVWGPEGEIVATSFWINQASNYNIGRNQFPGWDEGLLGATVGSIRQLVVPAELVGQQAPSEDPINPYVMEVEIVKLTDQ